MQTAVCQPPLGVGTPHILVPVSGLRFTPIPGIMSKSLGQKIVVRTQPRPILPKQRIIIRNDIDSAGSSSIGRDDWVRSRRELLRRKFEQRPSRERLVTQHILLSDGRVSPLIEQQARLLRQNRIKNNLSRKLGQRPGPLELVTRKILQVDAELEQAIKEGRLPFTPTSEDTVEEEEVLTPITPDMEVISQVAVKQPPKLLGSLTSKGILRKPGKGNPYKLFEQSAPKGKTKTPESRLIEPLEEPPRQTQIPRHGDQNNYELLLQQQQLFLQWQNDTGMGTPDGSQSADTIVIDQGMSTSPGGQIVRVRKLSDLKVQDLKNECKKRQLPVSGAKPQLLDRLRGFEDEILGATPPPSPPIQKDEVQVISSISEQNKESLMLNHNNEYTAAPRQCSPPEIIFQSETRSKPQQNEYVQQATMRSVTQLVPVQSNTSQLVQLVDERGNVIGTVQLQPTNDNTPQTVVMQPRIINNSHHQHVEAMPQQRIIHTQNVQKQNDNTFCFSQMGSGGHFTAVQQNEVMVEQQKLRAIPGTMMVNTAPRNQMTHQVVTKSMGVSHPPQVQRVHQMQQVQQIQQVQQVQQVHQLQQPQSQTMMSSPQMVVYQNQNQQMQDMPRVVNTHQQKRHVTVSRSSPKLQSSPRVADHPECSPNMPHCDGTSRVDNCSPLEVVRENEEKITLDPNDPASVLTPSTLQMHEDMLRKQHKLIESMEKEVATAQEMLRKQQQIILAAKKNQQKLRERQRCESDEGNWARDVDIRNMNKTHIQHFLQHKSHVQKLSNITKEHTRLKMTEERLQEELHVDQAVHDIVRLIKQDPRTALLIVQLLRKYQLERTQDVQTGSEHNDEEVEMAPSNSNSDQPDIIESPIPRRSSYAGETSMTQDSGSTLRQDIRMQQMTSGPIEQQDGGHYSEHIEDDKHENVDMEAIFKSVLEDATRALSNNTPVQNVECTVSASMDSPKQNTNQQQWNPMVRQTAVIPQYQQMMQETKGHDMPMHHQPMSSHQQQQQMVEPQQHHNNVRQPEHQVFAPQQFLRENEGGYPSLDDVMAVVRADADFPDGGEPFGGIEYGSDELAQLLGDDWLNYADRSISTDGQYIPFQNDESGRSTDPMSLGIPMDTSSSHQMNGGMDWLDEVLHHEPVDAQLFGH